jgi:hypothetical protein
MRKSWDILSSGPFSLFFRLWPTVPNEEKAVAVLLRARQNYRAGRTVRRSGENPISFGTIVITVPFLSRDAARETPRQPLFWKSASSYPVRLNRPFLRAGCCLQSCLSAMEHPVYDLGVIGVRAEN